LNQIHDVNTANRSIHLGAGVRLSQLNARTEPQGLFFPVDLSTDPMMGGMVSTNTGGSRFLRYGDVRANTLALKVVLPDEHGTVLELGSAVRKNNTGVDWKQIFIGTGGAFGIVTECTMSLERSLKQTATALITPRDDAAVTQLLELIEERFGSLLTAFETMSGAAIQHALSHVPSLRNPFSQKTIPDISLLVELGAPWAHSGDDSRSLESELLAFLSGVWDAPTKPIADAVICPPTEIWRVRHSLSEGVRNAGELYAFDLGFQRDRLMSFRSEIRKRLKAQYPELEICDFGHAGDGGIHLNLVRPNGLAVAECDFEGGLRDFVIDIAVNEFEGSFSAEHGLGRKNQKYYVPAPLRGELVRLFGEELRLSKNDLGELVTIEAGKIPSEGLGEVQEMIDICDFAVGLSRQLYGLTIATERPGHRMMETWHPMGVVGVISAFNFPVAVWAWNTALALVCGNAVVWKPSEKTPLTALACLAIFQKAVEKFEGDVPDGLASLLIGERDKTHFMLNPRLPR